MKVPSRLTIIIQLFVITFLAAQFSLIPKSHADLPQVKKGQPLPSDIFIELAKLVNPATVNINTQTVVGRRSRDPMIEMLEQFYGMRERPQQARSLGTGFIVRDDGLIITNNHVIEGANTIKVQLAEKDAKMYDARLIGRDARSDIALIKIDAKRKLPAVKLGDSDKLEVGEWVAAFGNPVGLGHSVSKGIVSAIGRNLDELNRNPLIQTDANINMGNSGGPLVNLQGEVVGVNSAIAQGGGGGLSFAIPSNAVKEIMPVLEKDGSLRRGYIGVILSEITPQAAEMLRLKSDEGALVVDVQRGSPADRGGLKSYDVVTKAGDKPIEDTESLMRSIADTAVGKTIELTITRNGKETKSKITVGEHPDDKGLIRRPVVSIEGKGVPVSQFGIQLVDSKSKIAKDLGVRIDDTRPVVADVAPGSSAALGGLQPGDVISDVNRTPVKTPADVNGALKKGQTNFLKIYRQDRPYLVELKSTGP